MKPDAREPELAEVDILSSVLRRADNPDDLGTYLAEEIRDLTGAHCVVLVQCPSTATARHRVVSVNPLERREWAESPAVDRLYDAVHHTAAMQFWRGDEPREAADLLRQERYELSMVFPLSSEAVRVGAMLVLGLPDEEQVSSSIALLNALSAIAALVLFKSLVFEHQKQVLQKRTEELQEANRQLQVELAEREKAEALVDGQKLVLELIVAGAPLPDLLTALVSLIEAHAPGMVGSILLLDAEGIHLRHGAAPSLPPEYTAAIDGVSIGPKVGSCGTAAYSMEPVFVEDIATHPLWSEYKGVALPHGLRACWSTPIFDSQRRVLGTFAMYYRQPALPEPYHLRLIDVTTHLAAIAIGHHGAAVALRESEERLRLAVQASDVGLWDWDLRSSKVAFSHEWKRQIGYDDTEIGNEFSEWERRVHPDDLEPTTRTLNAYLEGRLPEYAVEFRLRHKDGSYRWIHARGEVFRDADGRQTRMMGCHLDITRIKRAEEAQRRLNRELRAISDCNLALMRAEDEQALLNDVCRIICEEAGYRFAWAGYADDDDAKTVRPVAWAGLEDGYLASAHLTWADTERGRGPSGTAIRSGESVCIQDFSTDPKASPWRDSALQRGYRSSIALPLKDEGGNTFGVLNIYSLEPESFTADEIWLMEELAGDMAFGIMVLRSRVERGKMEESLTLRNRMNEIFLTFSGEEMYGEVLQVVLGVMESRYGVFAYIDEDGSAVAPSLTRDVWEKCDVPDKSIVFPRNTWGNSIWGRVLTEKRSLYTNGPVLVPPGHVPIVRALDVPILFQGEVSGHFLVGNKDTDYDDRDTEKLEGMARSIAAILNARLQQELQEKQRRKAEESLRMLTEDLELRVRERTAELEAKNAELERMNRLFVGRELRMVELKERIRELERGTGRPGARGPADQA